MKVKTAVGRGFALLLLIASLSLAGCHGGSSPLTGGATITVTDGTNPLADASVTLNEQTETTNDAGQVTFENVPVGNYTVRAEKTGYASSSADISIADGATATATLILSQQFGSATITVNDGTNPLADASVTLNEQTKTTGTEGQVTFENVPVGVYTVTAEKTGYTSSSAVISIADGETATATLTLSQQFGSATITVNDGTNPLAGASVTLNGRTETTDAAGRVTFENVPVGVYTVTAEKTGYTSSSAVITIADGATATATISLTRQTGSATITVNDGANPIGDASVTIGTQTQNTNALGVASFSNVPTGLYTVTAAKTGYDSGTAAIEVTHGATATATISLTRQTGDVSVWVFEHRSDGNVTMSGVNVTMDGRTVPTNSSGRADFTNVPTGTYTATASHPGFVTKSISVTVADGRALDTSFTLDSYQILLEKPAAGQIMITALRADGSPLVGATVELMDTTPFRRATTNAQGQVIFNNVVNGEWGVRITPASGLYTHATSITVTDTDTTFIIQSPWW